MSNQSKGLIAYFAKNPVAANLIMIFILLVGSVSGILIQKQLFPNLEINYINVTAVYPGASVKDVEEGFILKVEQAISDVTGVEEIASTASSEYGSIYIEVSVNADVSKVLSDVKQRVDSINGLPSDLRPIVVKQIEWQQEVLILSVVGERSLVDIKRYAESMGRELLMLPEVKLVDVVSPVEEVAVSISPFILEKLGLGIADVVSAINNYSVNASSGEIETEAGTYTIRVENKGYKGDDFRDVPLITKETGVVVRLGDVAKIEDGLEDDGVYSTYSGKNAVSVYVRATSTQSSIPVAESVFSFLEEYEANLPDDMSVEVVIDTTLYLEGRLKMMLTNLAQGVLLVGVLLSVFLQPRLAFWVVLGLPVSFLGAIMVMPLIGVTINMITLFAFIMVLGIVVDDAIVVGESAYSEIQKSGSGVEPVVAGVQKVATPATFGVLTTISVFAPFLMSEGIESAIFFGLSSVVILCLLFSLVESKLVLPAHLAHTHFKPVPENSYRGRFNKAFDGFVSGSYRNFLEGAVSKRWVTIIAFVLIMAFSISMLMGGTVKMVGKPKIPSDYPFIKIEMLNTATSDQLKAALIGVEAVVWRADEMVISEHSKSVVRGVVANTETATTGMLIVPLVNEEDRPVNAFELSDLWDELMPEFDGVKSITITDDGDEFGSTTNFEILLYGSDAESLLMASSEVRDAMEGIPSFSSLSSERDSASVELNIKLKPLAYSLGLTYSDVSRQVSAAYYGVEAQSFIRDGQDVRVMVRFTESSRNSLSALERTKLKLSSGGVVWLSDVAHIEHKQVTDTIVREFGHRVSKVSAKIDSGKDDSISVIENLTSDVVPKILEKYDGVDFVIQGEYKDQADQGTEQVTFFFAGMVMVYMMLAIPLKSYSQPLIVMSVIPFSLAGAVFGHYIIGIDMSLMSSFGLIAASGVVINDSLVLTDRVNSLRREGYELVEAIVEAGCSRFRAIALTSITTFVGVLPLMLETSLQAQYVKPMAVALGFTVMYATVLTLVLVPCFYMVGGDIKRLRAWVSNLL